MTTIIKSLVEWKVILLDTSIIIALIQHKHGNSTDERIKFIRHLISLLAKNNSGDGKSRVFAISSISICEILTRLTGEEKLNEINHLIGGSEITYYNFDIETALSFSDQLRPELSIKKLNKKASKKGEKIGDIAIAREWIVRDMMILMNGKINKVDVALTVDKKTFYPLANDLNIFCALAYKEYWKYGPMFLISYDHDKALRENLQ